MFCSRKSEWRRRVTSRPFLRFSPELFCLQMFICQSFHKRCGVLPWIIVRPSSGSLGDRLDLNWADSRIKPALNELTWTSSLVPHHNVNFTGHFSPEQIRTQTPCQSRSDDQNPGHFSTETEPQMEPNNPTNGPLRTARTVIQDVFPNAARLWRPNKTIPAIRRKKTHPVEPFTINLAKRISLVMSTCPSDSAPPGFQWADGTW